MTAPFLRLATTLVFLSLAGCATPSNDGTNLKRVKIISNPSGAHIEINGEHVGEAPLDISLPTTPGGRFLQSTVIRALPSEAGETIQTRSFTGSAADSREMQGAMPSEIIFDMHASGGTSSHGSPAPASLESGTGTPAPE